MLSSSKHQRGGSEREEADSSNAKATKKTKTNSHASSTQTNSSSSHATFWDLPTELRSTILDLASQKPDSAAYGGSRLRLDRKTIHSLTLVSRQFHSTFNPVLYSHVKLTKPSILAEFRQSLFEKPSLGLMVKSLHLGPLSELREGWWPVRTKDSHGGETLPDRLVLLRTSWTKRDESRRPRWCKPCKEWDWQLSARTCYGAAVGNAISAALRGVGLKVVDLELDEDDFEDGKGAIIGINKWTVRLFQVQAALDLYLCEMRRIEDVEKRPVPCWRWKAPSLSQRDPEICRTGKCGHYPRLVLNGFEGSESDKPKGTSQGGGHSASRKEKGSVEGIQSSFVVTQGQVSEHLARRGATVDHFDHPLIFARSNLKQLSRDSEGRVVVNHDDYEEREEYYSDYDEYDSDYDGSGMPYNDEDFTEAESMAGRSLRSASTSSVLSEHYNSPPPEVFDPTRRNDLVALGRSAISLAARLQSLSVTGWLSRCLDRKSPDLSILRTLSLGPLLPPYSTRVCMYAHTLPNVSKLRLAGYEPYWWVAKVISEHRKGTLPKLKSLEWDYGGSEMDTENSYSLEKNALDVISQLQSGRSAGDSPLGTTDQSNVASGSGNDTSSGEEEMQKAEIPPNSNCYAELRLHPDIFAAVIKQAPSARIGTAWVNGSSVPGGQYRVRVMESRATVMNESDSETSEQNLNVLRRESEQWWEERALEIERGELPEGGE